MRVWFSNREQPKESDKLFCARLTSTSDHHLFMNFIGSDETRTSRRDFDELRILQCFSIMRRERLVSSGKAMFAFETGRLHWANGQRKYVDLVLNVWINKRHHRESMKWHDTAKRVLACYIYGMRKDMIFIHEELLLLEVTLLMDVLALKMAILRDTNYMTPGDTVLFVPRSLALPVPKRPYKEEEAMSPVMQHIYARSKTQRLEIYLLQLPVSVWINDETCQLYGPGGKLLTHIQLSVSINLKRRIKYEYDSYSYTFVILMGMEESLKP